MFPYDPQHQTFLNIYEGNALTQAILDRGRTSFEYFAGHAAGRVRGGAEVPAGRHPPHPDRAGSPAVPRRPAAARRLGAPARADRDLVHRRAQHHAVARRAQHRQPAGADHRAGDRAEHRLRRRRQPADPRTAATCAPGSRSRSASSTASASPTCCARWTCRRGRSAGRCSRSTSASRSVSCWSSPLVATALAALRSRSEAAGRRLAFAGSIVVMAAGAFWFIQRVFFPGGIS